MLLKGQTKELKKVTKKKKREKNRIEKRTEVTQCFLHP